jgi:hypothetical protein
LGFTFKNKAVQPNDSPADLGMSDDENVIQVSIIGHFAGAAAQNGSDALRKEAIVQACTAGSTHMALDLLSQNGDLCTQPLSWYDSDGLELSTPPIFICIDYGHAELVANLLLLHDTDTLNTLKGGDGGYSALQWASWTVCFMLVLKLSIFSNHFNSRHRFLPSTKGKPGDCKDISRRR